MRRLAVLLLLTMSVTGAVTGFAASLPVTSANMGSGVAPITSCDRDGVSASYTVVLGLVTHVVVSHITDGNATAGRGACDGQTVHVQAVDGAGAAITGAAGSMVHLGDADTSNDAASVALLVAPAASAVAGVRITISQ